MKCQSLFSGENKKIIISLWSAEFAQKLVKEKAEVSIDNLSLCFKML